MLATLQRTTQPALAYAGEFVQPSDRVFQASDLLQVSKMGVHALYTEDCLADRKTDG